MRSFSETFRKFLKDLRVSSCHRLIKYQTRKIEFKGLNIAAGKTVEISLADFNHEIKNIVESIPGIAQALDDYQYNIWRYLEYQKQNDYGLTQEDRRMYNLAVFIANNHMFLLRSALETARQDPIGQRDILRTIIQNIQAFVRSLTIPKQERNQCSSV